MPIRAHMQYLFLQLQKNNANDWMKQSINPAVIPPLDISIDDLQVNHRLDGRVHFVTQPIQGGLAIQTMTVQSPLFKFFAKGSWIAHHFESDTTLIGRVSSPDLGAALSQRRLSSRLKDGIFSSDFSLTWPGAPHQFSIERAVGRMDILVKKGSILQLDSDTETNLALGKLLNLFSLESISHLLSFNFSALTKKGFAFDVLQGNFEFSRATLFSQKI